MKNAKLGDHCVVYSHRGRELGIIRAIEDVYLQVETVSGTFTYHKNQCRRLKKKECREFKGTWRLFSDGFKETIAFIPKGFVSEFKYLVTSEATLREIK